MAVTITNYTGGSVVNTTETAFEDNDATSAAQYANVMKSGDPTLVFGTGYGSVTVDPNSVTTGQATNPASKSLSSFLGQPHTMITNACSHKEIILLPLKVSHYSCILPSLTPILVSINQSIMMSKSSI